MKGKKILKKEEVSDQEAYNDIEEEIFLIKAC